MRNVNDFKIYVKKRQIKLAMIKKLYEIKDLAKLTHYSESHIFQTINYQRGVSLQCARSYCKALDKEFDDIFKIKGNERK